ncbi:MAG: hypothetical protein QM811_13175 [Pirellulales bacterium]
MVACDSLSRAKRPPTEGPAIGNLFLYVGNNPVNSVDPTGLLETHDVLDKNTQNLVDVSGKLEDYINQVVQDAANNPNNDTAAKFIREVFQKLGQVGEKPPENFPERFARYTKIGEWLQSHLDAKKNEIVDVPFKDSRYGCNDVGLKSPVWSFKTPEAAEHTIAPTLKIGDVLIGLDKLEHMFQQGHWLLEYSNRDDKGLQRSDYKLNPQNFVPLLKNDNDRDNFGRYLEGGELLDPQGKPLGAAETKKLESGFNFAASVYFGGALGLQNWKGHFGSGSSGVISNADVVANKFGFEFYREILNHYKNKTLGQYKFKFSDFDIKQLNEGHNPSTFIPEIKGNCGMANPGGTP